LTELTHTGSVKNLFQVVAFEDNYMNAKNKNETPQVARGNTTLAANGNTPLPGTGSSEAATIVTAKELLRRYPIGCRKSLYNHCKAGSIPSIVLKGGRKRFFHIPSVEATLLFFQKGGVL
jgi:hypothetical protein